MTVTQDMTILALVTQASLLVQMVMVLLLMMSFLSWWFIFRKFFVIRAAMQQAKDFEKKFWSGSDLGTLFQAANENKESSGILERIFESGLREFGKLRKQTDLSLDVLLDGTRRAMRVTYQREMDQLEIHLSFLATVGSISPYIGLFGTVWGIMNSFRGLAHVGQATLAQVAPGIAEALVATAMGLFAAIPAVVAYNHYVRNIERLSVRLDSFMEEFSNILQRQAGGPAQPSGISGAKEGR